MLYGLDVRYCLLFSKRKAKAVEEIVNFVVVLVIFSCVLSIVSGPFRGKKSIDPFFILRPFIRNLRVGSSRLFRALSKELNKHGKKALRNAGRRSNHPVVRILLYGVSLLLYAGSVVVALPAFVLGKK